MSVINNMHTTLKMSILTIDLVEPRNVYGLSVKLGQGKFAQK